MPGREDSFARTLNGHPRARGHVWKPAPLACLLSVFPPARYYLWFGGRAGVVPLTLWIPAFAGMTWVRGPYGLGRPSGLLWFRRSQQLPLRIPSPTATTIFVTGFFSSVAPISIHRKGRRLSVACGGTSPAGRMLATPCYPARCRTSLFSCSISYVEKGCARNPCRRGDSSCLEAPV